MFHTMLRTLCALFFIFPSPIKASAWDEEPVLNQNFAIGYDQQITDLLASNSSGVLEFRMEFFSRAFIGKPYSLGALGEGENGRFDQDPLYRTDIFDCTTFVETVIALSVSQTLEEFKENIDALRYLNSNVDYLTRNHIVEIDWNAHNIINNRLRNLTLFAKELDSQISIKFVTQTFNKQLWYHAKTVSDLQLPLLSPKEKELRLNELKALGDYFTNETVDTAIIGVADISRAVAKLKVALNSPSLVINLVRTLKTPVPGLSQTLVTHQALLVWERSFSGDAIPRVRHARSARGIRSVVNQSLEEFISMMQEEPSYVGVQLLQVIPR